MNDPDLDWSEDDVRISDLGSRSSPAFGTETVDAEYESAEPPGSDPPRGRSRRRSDPQRSLARIDRAWMPPPLPPWIDIRPVTGAVLSPDLVMAHAPNSLAAQQFRSLRYRIEQEPDLQIVAVTSARGNEGKSVTAANLALALAEGGRVRVLLLDASLRVPAQAKLFGLGQPHGLTSVLARQYLDENTKVTVHLTEQLLFVLTSGPRVPSPHAVLESEIAAHLLGSLRRVFRYIVVDSSAVFGPAETLAWHGMVDRYVLVARRAVTTTEDLAKASDRLNREKVLGITLVGVRGKTVNA